MGRLSRVVAVGLPHHITQRGNNRRDVFFTDFDRTLYLDLLQEYCSRYKLAIEAYCLMSNHVHFVAIPHRDDSLARALGRTHNDYARFTNIRHKNSGHLWQNRFFSCPLDAYHLWQTMRYIELNPVRAGIAAMPAEWRWSTAAFHLGQVAPHPVVESGLWSASWDADRWREALDLGFPDQALLDRIRSATTTGRPLGGDHFVADLEQLLQRTIHPQRRGPSRTTAVNESFEVA